MSALHSFMSSLISNCEDTSAEIIVDNARIPTIDVRVDSSLHSHLHPRPPDISPRSVSRWSSDEDEASSLKPSIRPSRRNVPPRKRGDEKSKDLSPNCPRRSFSGISGAPPALPSRQPSGEIISVALDLVNGSNCHSIRKSQLI